MRGTWLENHVRPIAFGNEIGRAVAGAIAAPVDNRALLNAANQKADPDYYKAQSLGLSGNALPQQAINIISQSSGLSDDQFDRLSALRAQLNSGAVVGPEIVTRPDLAYINEQGESIAANARFNRTSGQIEISRALVSAANTPGGAANLLAALNEEHAEWALHAANVSMGRDVDGGAVMGFGSMLSQMGAMGRQGVANLDYSVVIDGSANSYSTNVNSMFDATGDTFSSSRIFGNLQDADSAYQVRTMRNMRSGPVQMATNARGQDIMDVIGFSDAFGLIPEAYRDIKQIGAQLDDMRLNKLLDVAKTRLQTELGPRTLPTPEALGVTMAAAVAPGMASSDRPQREQLLDRYVDGIRKIGLERSGQITMDYSNFEILTIGNQKLTPAQYQNEIETRYQKSFTGAVAEGQRRFNEGRLRYPVDMPEQLQVGLYADNRAREQTIAYNRSLGLTEGPGQLLSMNRWAYDMQGSGNYVRPDVFIDLGPSKRYWVDGKSSFVDTNLTQQFRNFYSYTGAAGGKIATPQGLYEIPGIKAPKPRFGR